MKPEAHDKSEFLREAAKELLEDGQPHSYGEIVKFIRGRAEGTNWEGQVEVNNVWHVLDDLVKTCLLYTSPSPRDPKTSRMPSSA